MGFRSGALGFFLIRCQVCARRRICVGMITRLARFGLSVRSRTRSITDESAASPNLYLFSFSGLLKIVKYRSLHMYVTAFTTRVATRRRIVCEPPICPTERLEERNVHQ